MTSKRVFVAGHRGMVGSAIVRRLQSQPGTEVITAARAEVNLTEQASTRAFFQTNQIDEVYLAAAKVGGIQANNTAPASFIYENLMIEANVIEAAHRADVNHLLFLGSSCIYPRMASQPMAESALLTGTLERTNEPYAVAKIAGIKLAESYHRQHGRDYRSVMPTNLYGPGDNFHPEHSHVLPALLRRIHEAALARTEAVTIWGSGSPRREFLHVDDMAAAAVHVMGLSEETYWSTVDPMNSHVNVGTGVDISIAELARAIAEVVGFEGDFEFDTSKPDGTPRKLLDVSLLASLGWTASITLDEGLRTTFSWYLENEGSLRAS